MIVKGHSMSNGEKPINVTLMQPLNKHLQCISLKRQLKEF